MKTKPFFSSEENSVVMHDGHGNKTVIALEGDEDYSYAISLIGQNPIDILRDWVGGICCEFRRDSWKSTLLNSIISRESKAA